MAGSIIYTLRLALKNPDVTWNHKKNPEPWMEYSDKQYKVSTLFYLDIFTKNWQLIIMNL